MNVTFDCPKCDLATKVEFKAGDTSLECPLCEHSWAIKPESTAEGRISSCVICPSDELYVRKDFSQTLGVTIISIGLAISCIPWYYGMWYATYAILFGTAIVDAILYVFTGNMLQCYRCHSQYRDIAGLEDHGAFDLEVHERYRQQAARLESASSPAPPATVSGAETVEDKA